MNRFASSLIAAMTLLSAVLVAPTPVTSPTPAISSWLQIEAARNGSPKWKRGGFIGGEPSRIGLSR